ncbi:molybdopterin-dependent oxidoreductase [Streptomyces lunaelactis]|uniref:molybdopterin-dependent oxidoreductase n=1 Tax=Streptomyces lunaelactis TaxID=1535768 RepID=UPI002816429E|nr:molybdopterin cofactor-binding domain-containing protein [Streptomyces lunaelactis]
MDAACRNRKRAAAPMDVTVNGTARQVGSEPDATAVHLVRETLGLTGTKLVCGAGVCGACTVHVDGVPKVACLTPAAALEGTSVTTVEGLQGKHPVQRAFAAHDALQCGYCTPGFVMEAAAFVDRWRAEHGDSSPSRAEIAAALAGHLCRCGAYEGIYAAVAAACTGAHDKDDAPPPRVEAMQKITGQARYTTDIHPDGLLDGVIIRSRHAHARVRSVSGVDQLVDLLPADRTVRYVGQPIAAVAGETLAAAEAAAERVQVDYEVLPATVDLGRAELPDSPVVYPTKEERKQAPTSSEGLALPAKWNGNVRGPVQMNWRGTLAQKRIEQARDQGEDRRLVEATYTAEPQAHTSLEPHACLASWDGDGDLHLWVSTQAIGLVAERAAERFGLRPGQVHASAVHVGGGFGSKLTLTSEIVAAAELARMHAAPVRVVLTRAEELTDGGYRPGTRADIALLTDEDGKLAALTLDVHGDGGTSTGSGVAALARFMYGHAPRRLRDYDIVTHRAPATPFRGPGGPPLAWVLEQTVDETAHRRGEDPIALRRRWDGNSKRRALYDVAAALPMWTGRPATGSQTGRFRRGVGVAAANWMYFLDPGTQVELTVEEGTVVARTATQDMGQGSRSVIADVIAAELGLPADRVRVDIGRTGTVHGPASGGSRTATSIAPAARDAAVRLRAALGSALAARAPARGTGGVVEQLLADAEGLRVVGKRPRDRRGYVTPVRLGGVLIGRGFTGAVHVTEVEVDTRLGRTRVTRVWGGIAAGRIISPAGALSQCQGGVIQGIGYALYEERVTDPLTGVVLSDNLEDYRIPGIGDIPEIDIHFHEEGFDHVDGGGVGLGEVSTMPVAASVGNAVHAATGWRPHHLPIRPDRLLEGLRP